MSHRKLSRHDEAGFGLIEILVAVLVLAIGVIGFAGLQARAVQASGDSYYRTQAMSIAEDMAERIDVNRGPTTEVVGGVTKVYPNGKYVPEYRNSVRWPTTSVGATAPNKCLIQNCLALDFVDFDAQSARYNAETLLPAGLIRVEQCQGSNLTCVYVAWDGLQPGSAATGGQCATALGTYQPPPAGQVAITCVMVEV